MVFRFHSLLSYGLPGVLVLLSGWWYSSRRKNRSAYGNRDWSGVQCGQNAGQVQARGSAPLSPHLEGSAVDLLPSDENHRKLEQPTGKEPEGRATLGWKMGLVPERSWAGVVASSLSAEMSGKQLPSSGVPSPSNHLESIQADGDDHKALMEKDSAGGVAVAFDQEGAGEALPFSPVVFVVEGSGPCESGERVGRSDAVYCPCLTSGASVRDDSVLPSSNMSIGSHPVEVQRAGSDTAELTSYSPGSLWTQSHSPPVFPPSPQAPDLVEWEVEVPEHLVGRLIGKKGRSVSFLKRSSGAKIYVFSTPVNQNIQICHIEGSMPQVDKALQLIGEKFADLDLTNRSVAPDPALNRPSTSLTTWLTLPEDVAVEVAVVNVVSVGHLFIHQHKHLSHRALHSLEEKMYLCYAQRGVPHLLAPVQSGTVCAAPGSEGAWWRAQVSAPCEDPAYVEVRYVDYGGYKKVKVESLRQIRSDFVSLPFQGIEVLLDNLAPLPGEKGFSKEATMALKEKTRGVTLLAQVTKYDMNGLPMVLMWKRIGDKLVSLNHMLAEEGFCSWVEHV